MDFEQWMTVVGIGAAPVGIVLGWGLKQLSDTLQFKAAGKDRKKQEHAARAIRLLAAASTIKVEGWTLTHQARYQAVNGHPRNPASTNASMELFNQATSDLDALILEAEVLGPYGLGDIGVRLATSGQNVVTVVTEYLEDGTTAQENAAVSEALPQLEDAIEKAIKEMRVLLTSKRALKA